MAGERVALAILAMDLYESTKSALNALRDKMATGGIVVPLNYGSRFGAMLYPCPTMLGKVTIRF